MRNEKSPSGDGKEDIVGLEEGEEARVKGGGEREETKKGMDLVL